MPVVSLIVNVVGPDKPGLVNAISERALAAGANWQESRLAKLAGQFAGIIHLQVDDGHADALADALRGLSASGLQIVVTRGIEPAAGTPTRLLLLALTGQDRPGIVREISRILAERNVGIDELSTACEAGSFTGGTLFRASARLQVPATVATDELRHVLESLANDLMVDVELEQPPGGA